MLVHGSVGVGELVFVILMCCFLFEVSFLFGLGGRDARPYVPRVRNGRCPASALECFGPGPLGDASGKFSLVLAFVTVIFVTIAGVMCAPLC